MKVDRKAVFDKFGGRCAYCGTELVKGWHVDHLEACVRKWKWIKGHWSDGWFAGMTEQEMIDLDIKWVEGKNVPDGYENPEANHEDNYMPACASCNINKHSMSLDGFRNLILGFMKHLNEVSTQYKIAKRYGLVTEDIKPIVFYFEFYLENLNPKNE